MGVPLILMVEGCRGDCSQYSNGTWDKFVKEVHTVSLGGGGIVYVQKVPCVGLKHVCILYQ